MNKKQKILKIAVLVFIFLETILKTINIVAFDIERYMEIIKAEGFHQAWWHAIHLDPHENIKTIGEEMPNNNFDWQYYVNNNNLTIDNERDAVLHYRTKGEQAGLKYCKSFDISILVHIYKIDLLDEFINKINYFIHNNHENQYHIKITIPIDNNINEYNNYKNVYEKYRSEAELATVILSNTPYHKELINKNNISKLYYLYRYIFDHINLPKNNIQVVFMENRGADVGGFFLGLDQLIKQNIKHDFIIKLHSKANDSWRNSATSFLMLPINKLLSNNGALYSFKSPTKYHHDLYNYYMMSLIDKFNIKYDDSSAHSSGNMFIVSNKFTKFFQQYDLINIFNELSLRKENYEWAVGYEILFGCIIDSLNLKVQVIDRISQPIDNII